MSTLTHEQEEYLDDVFSYHPPSCEEDIESYRLIREAGKTFARVVMERTPHSADQMATLRKIRESVMTANAAVALKGKA